MTVRTPCDSLAANEEICREHRPRERGAYCKQGWAWDFWELATNFYFDDSPPVWHECSNSRPFGNHTDEHWMDDNCNPGDDSLGVERDWLAFYWHLYTEDTSGQNDPANKFGMKQIFELHSEARDYEGLGERSYHWQSLYDAAKRLWEQTDPEKFQNFREHATTRGVMHCSGGCQL